MKQMNPFNADVVGPGIWYMLHTKALQANTVKKREEFKLYIDFIYDNFHCNKCMPHFKLYLQSKPIHKCPILYDSVRGDIGLFKWTWEFHNDVNVRLGKPEVSFLEAYNFYNNVSFYPCTTCNDTPAITPIKTIDYVRIPKLILDYKENKKQSITFNY